MQHAGSGLRLPSRSASLEKPASSAQPMQQACSTSYAPAARQYGHHRASVRCGSSINPSVRFRLEYTPPRDDDAGPSFHGRPESIGGEVEDDIDLHSMRQRPQQRPGTISTRNRHAPQAALLTPFRMPHQGPLSNEEYYVVELRRDYNRDLPRVEKSPEGKLVFRPGFLQLLVDPDIPLGFTYSGVERFVYTLPERGLQAVATAVCVAAAGAAFTALASWQPEFAAALLISWLRNSLSLLRVACLAVLLSFDKMWLYWALLAGKIVDGVLYRHAPPVREVMWWVFKVWIGWCLLTTAITPVLPFGPFAPWAGGAFTYPFPIPRM